MRDSVIEVVVANQQSASASILSADGMTMKHVAVGNGPHEAAISPDGKVAVVSVYGTQVPGNQIAVIDLIGDTLVRTIDLGTYKRPHGMVFIGAGSNRLAVTSEATQNVVIVDLASGAVEAAIPTQARGSHMIALTADGTRGFTANVGGNSVSEIDVAGKKLVRSFPVPPQPEGIAVTPDGAEVWVGSNQTGAVSIISTQTGQIAHTISGVTFPYRLGASPNGRLMAIIDGNGNRVHIASVAEHRILGAIDLAEPRGVSIAADNRTAYVTLGAGTLAIVDIVDFKVLRTIAVESSPDGVAVRVRH